jgi:hypothetical protein
VAVAATARTTPTPPMTDEGDKRLPKSGQPQVERCWDKWMVAVIVLTGTIRSSRPGV